MPVKPSEQEEEYFARLEFERLKKKEEERQKKLAADERKRMKELHFMQCPKCGMKLVEIDYKGIKIDKCSECEGVWLDAGELDAVSRLDKSVASKLLSALRR